MFSHFNWVFLFFNLVMASKRKWTEEDMQKARAMVENGSSLHDVEQELNIPKSTLYSRIKKGG